MFKQDHRAMWYRSPGLMDEIRFIERQSGNFALRENSDREFLHDGIVCNSAFLREGWNQVPLTSV
ncbi:MAG: hypothetical protein ACYC3O_02545 [Burkholderiales bacterium]